MTKIITAHDPAWKTCFAAERHRLLDLFGPTALAIHHIGSTAIPDIWAKPVIDILIEASDFALIDARAGNARMAGYEARGEYGIPGRRYFVRRAGRGEKTDFHVHVYERKSPHLTRHLAFRDYLLARPEIAAAYSDLKRHIADPSGVLPPDYAARKDEFVRDVERAALSLLGANSASRTT